MGVKIGGKKGSIFNGNLQIVFVAVAVIAMYGCVDEEPVSTHSLPNSEQVPSPTIKEDTFEKIEGLTAIRISGGTWKNWDADIENDGPVVEIRYLDAIGDTIYDNSNKKMPISADVKIYAGDSPSSQKTKLVFSAQQFPVSYFVFIQVV